MKATSVDDVSIKWFKSYLNNRTQRTVLGNAISSSRIVTIGVPQGSVLGPLLFLVYINDLTERLNHSVASLFADDTAIYCSATSTQELQRKLNEDLCGVKDWLNSHKLTLNTTKSKFMVIGGTQRLNGLENLNLVIDEELLDRVDHFKYLGVVINENKMIDFQLDNICNSQVHSYATRFRNNRVLPLCQTNWAQCRSNLLFVKEWNILPYYVKSSSSFNAFKINYWKSLNN